MNLPQSLNRICIFRALQLGDLLCSVPALRALRSAFPEAHITLLGLPWAASLVARFPDYIDEFIHFPGYPGLPEQEVDAAAVTAFLSHMQAEKYDLILQMQGNGTIVNAMLPLLGSRLVGGFYTKSDFRPNDKYFVEYPEGIHEIDRHLALMNFLGIQSEGRHLEYPLTQKDEDDLSALQLPIIKHRYVIIHPGSRGAWRQWPIEHFAAIGDYAASLGLDVIITGTKDELPITEAVGNIMKQPSINVAGKTSMGAVGVLIRDAFALVSNCTGVSHIAAASKTPSIVISMDGEPERWGPLNHAIHKTIDWTREPDFEKVLRETTNLFSKRPFLV